MSKEVVIWEVFPHEFPGYRHVSDTTTRDQFEYAWGVKINPEPGLRIPNMFEQL